MKPISVIKAPLVAEEYFSGVSLMADALIKANLESELNAKISAELPQQNFNPTLDWDGSLAKKIVALLKAGLTSK